MPDRPHFKSLHDPVAGCESGGATAISDPLLSHHEIEQLIWRELQSIPTVHFSSLTVRRFPDGVCLQGVMESDGDESTPDINGVVRRVARVENVVNQLLQRELRRPSRLPR